MDPQNGYNATTNTYHSLYPSLDLPPKTLPLSAANVALSLLQSATNATTTTTAFVDGSTGHSLSFSEFLSRVRSLAHFLTSDENRPHFEPLTKGRVAMILSPPSIHIPVLYFALLSLGTVVFPTSPLATESELVQLVRQARPSIAFTVSSLSNKVESLPYSFSHGTILLDSPEFNSMLTFKSQHGLEFSALTVYQSDTAAMISSSSTTGPAKIVELTHHNIIATIYAHVAVDVSANKNKSQRPLVMLSTTKLELVLGFIAIMRSIATAQTMVLLERCNDLGTIMQTLERYKVDVLIGYPMLVGAMAAEENAEVVDKYDVSSLKVLICGGMQLHERHYKLFKDKFPHADVIQGYGLTEISGVATLQLGTPNGKCFGMVGRLLAHLQAQIVDPSTAQTLPPHSQGELWLRGPTIMKGYVEDDQLTATKLDCKVGWFKTGDVCYFDSHGYLYFVDRLKEFITFNSYKVSPSELERILLLHPEIEDAIVAPYAEEEEGGEVPMALVIKKHGSTINESEVMDFVATKVEEHKRIQRVRFITSIPNFGKEKSLPISHQGKIKRKLMLTAMNTLKSTN